MNKGLEIWAKKHKGKKQQSDIKKPEQVGVVCFVNFKDVVYHKENGKYAHPEFVERKGLQVENRFYYISQEKIENCGINRKGAQVLNIISGIPEWADPRLIDKYNFALQKFTP